MPMPNRALLARPFENRSRRPASPVSSHSSTATLDMMGAPMSFNRNEEIYGEGEAADYLYKVASGAVRIYKVLNDGRREIGAFYFPGDIFGLEPGDQHASSAEAIGDETALVLKRSAVLALAARNGDVGRHLWEITANELDRSQKHSLLLILSAQERVTSFLLEMGGRSCTNTELELPMSRQDIADYLGLTIATLSRSLSQLESAGAIGVPVARRITFCNSGRLNRLNAC